MKTKKSFIIAVVSLMNTAIVSILSLVFTNLILKNYGSDYNGIVATVTQIMTILLVLEGGITYATNFALYKPCVEEDYDTINAILSKTKKQFIKIGLILFIVGLFISLVYPLIIKSNIDYFTIFFIIFFFVVSTSFNIFFTTKINVIFQANQQEYILSVINLIVNTVVYIIIILLASLKTNILLIRFVVMTGTFIIGISTYFMFKKIYPKASFNESKKEVKITGSNDIVVQRLTSIVYSSAPMLIMSTFIGTIYTSVYAVYNSVFNIIKTVLYSLVSAPSNGFGQLFSSKATEKVYSKFKLYEFIVIIILTCLLASVLSIIIPFVSLYTNSVTDVNYVDPIVAILFAIIVFFEFIHTPSGTAICVSGRFKAARNIQITALIVLVPSLIIGSLIFKLYGIMIALAITSILLSFMEIIYAHKKVFNANLKTIVKMALFNLILIIAESLIWNCFNISFTNYFQFFVYGIVIFLINSSIIIILNKIVFNEYFIELLNMVKNIIINFKNKEVK